MQELTASDKDFIQHIIEDLDYLHKLGASGRKAAAEARHASVIVRRLVLDKDLKRAASLLRQKLSIMLSPEFPKKVEFKQEGIVFAHTAMGMIGKNSYYHGFTSDKECLYLDVRDNVGFRTCYLDDFLNQKVLYYYGEYATRADILRYAANRMGGAHHGNKRIKNEELIAKAKGCIVFTPTDDGKHKISLELSRLLNLHEEVYPDKTGVNLVHLEVLSSARLISHCPEIKQLNERLKRLIKS